MANVRRPARPFTMQEAPAPAGSIANSGVLQTPQGGREMGNLRSRFIPLAESRMTAVLEAMDYLAQLSQRNRYHYTDEEWEVMQEALFTKLQELDDMFRRGKGSRPTFKFDSAAEG